MYGFPDFPGPQLHFGWWFLAIQVADSAQLSSSQAGLQTLLNLSQTSWSAQSSLYWQRADVQAIRGSPWVPRGHAHWARWATAVHSAPRPQTILLVRHGVMQLLFLQVLSFGQSSSDLHSAIKYILIFDKNIFIIIKF